MKYRKKPVVIDALEFTGTEASARRILEEFQIPGGVYVPMAVTWDSDAGYMTIPTLEGNHTANPGDFIIRGVQGEFYPCKPDIFAATYEPVVEPAPTPWPGSAPNNANPTG